jgi:hypothetical protein
MSNYFTSTLALALSLSLSLTSCVDKDPASEGSPAGANAPATEFDATVNELADEIDTAADAAAAQITTENADEELKKLEALIDSDQ